MVVGPSDDNEFHLAIWLATGWSNTGDWEQPGTQYCKFVFLLVRSNITAGNRIPVKSNTGAETSGGWDPILQIAQ